MKEKSLTQTIILTMDEYFSEVFEELFSDEKFGSHEIMMEWLELIPENSSGTLPREKVSVEIDGEGGRSFSFTCIFVGEEVHTLEMLPCGKVFNSKDLDESEGYESEIIIVLFGVSQEIFDISRGLASIDLANLLFFANERCSESRALSQINPLIVHGFIEEGWSTTQDKFFLTKAGEDVLDLSISIINEKSERQKHKFNN